LKNRFEPKRKTMFFIGENLHFILVIYFLLFRKRANKLLLELHIFKNMKTIFAVMENSSGFFIKLYLHI
jgi:hypothetical protein